MDAAKRFAGCFLIFLVVGTSFLHGEDWPTYQLNNNRNPHTFETFAFETYGQQWKWQSPSPPAPAWSGPAKWDAYSGVRDLKSMRNYDPVFHTVTVGDRVFFGSSVDDSVHCLDLHSGKVLWSYTTDGPIRIAPTVYKNMVYFGSDDGYAYCLSAANGDLVWKFSPLVEDKDVDRNRIVNNGKLIPLWPIRTGVAIRDDVAYFAASMLPWNHSYLCAVDCATGTVNGDQHYVQKLTDQTMEGAMIAAPQRLIVPQGRVAPQMFERSSGKSLGGLSGGGGCFVVLTPDEQIIHGPGNKTGWLTTSKQSSEQIATQKGGNAMVIAGDHSILLTNSEVVATNYKARKILWKKLFDRPLSLISTGEHVVIGLVDQIVAYRTDDGSFAWSAPVEGKAYGLSAANGRLLVSTDVGCIYCFGDAGQKTGGHDPSAKAIEFSSQPPPGLKAVEKSDDDSLLGQWVFQRPNINQVEVKDLQGNQNAQIEGPVSFKQTGPYEAMIFDGKSQRVVVAEKFQDAPERPTKEFTAEAWVSIAEPTSWGSIIGIIQDNGNYERGWILGNKGNRFMVGVVGKEGPGNLNYLEAKESFENDQWYHVAGTYDGASLKLYVNGELSNETNAQKGEIVYPPNAFFEIAAYHDKDENFLLNGELHEVRLYNRALSREEIQKNLNAKLFPKATKTTKKQETLASLSLGPECKFTGPSTVNVKWETKTDCPSKLLVNINGKESEFDSKANGMTHEVSVDGLKRDRIYMATILVEENGQFLRSEPFEIDTFFNYSLEPMPAKASSLVANELQKELVKLGLSEIASNRGVAIVVGCQQIELLSELANKSELKVIAIDTDQSKVNEARKRLLDAGIYGWRINVHHVESYETPLITGELANLMICVDQNMLELTHSEFVKVLKFLAPENCIAIIGPSLDEFELPKEFSYIRHHELTANGKTYRLARRNRISGSSDWSHLYGLPDNSAYCGEKLGGVSSSADLKIQWIGRPGARYQPDRSGRKPSPLAARGRLYLQGLHRLIALDQYNGTILWSLELPRVARFNMPRDCSNWCVDEKQVYIAVDDHCLVIDGATGVIQEHRPVVKAKTKNWNSDWGFIARTGNWLFGSSVKEGSSFRDFWGGVGWYDKETGEVTAKICSDNLFAVDLDSNSKRWEYNGGVIINSTVTIDDSRVYFVESRNKAVANLDSRRIDSPELWKSKFLVVLNKNTGEPEWETSLDTVDGTVVFYVAADDQRLICLSSTGKKYHVYCFAKNDGKPIWNQTLTWTANHHGAHMHRPLLHDNKIFIRPYVLNLVDGKVLPIKMPGGHGCGTYAASEKAIFYRAQTVTMWGFDTGETSRWPRLRPDCWLSTIPAGGMLLSPEGGGGCSCGSWMETSIGFKPKNLE